jgi:hypothetical protein
MKKYYQEHRKRALEQKKRAKKEAKGEQKLSKPPIVKYINTIRG